MCDIGKLREISRALRMHVVRLALEQCDNPDAKEECRKLLRQQGMRDAWKGKPAKHQFVNFANPKVPVRLTASSTGGLLGFLSFVTLLPRPSIATFRSFLPTWLVIVVSPEETDLSLPGSLSCRRCVVKTEAPPKPPGDLSRSLKSSVASRNGAIDLRTPLFEVSRVGCGARTKTKQALQSTTSRVLLWAPRKLPTC